MAIEEIVLSAEERQEVATLTGTSLSAVQAALEGLKYVPEPRFEYLPLSRLKRPAWQRNLRQSKIDRWSKDFTPAAMGTLTVSVRAGDDWLIDGQHRSALAQQNGEDCAWCEVRTGLTETQECIISMIRNRNSAAANADNWKRNLKIGDALTLRIQRAVANAGMRVVLRSDPDDSTAGRSQKYGELRCVETLYLVERDLHNLQEALDFIAHNFEGDTHAMHQAFVYGVARFMKLYGPKLGSYGWRSFEDKLQSYDARGVTKKANTQGTAKTAGRRMCQGLLWIYNHGRTSNRLKDIDDSAGEE